MNISRNVGGPLNDLEATLIEVEQVPRIEKIQRSFDRRTKVVSALVILVVLLYGVWLSYNSVQLAHTAAQSTLNEKDIADLREANQLRAEAGLSQIPLPPAGEPVDMKAVAAAAAAIALEDIKDDPRFRGPRGDSCDSNQIGCRGPSGPSGQPGIPGQQGDTGEPGLDGQEGPQGPEGPKGDPGQDGATPACMSEPSQCRGAQGEPGMPPCPEGYTPRWEPRLPDGALVMVCDPSQG